MRIYLAARYSRHVELQGYAFDLMSKGHIITSRWIWGTHKLDGKGLSVQAEQAERSRFANEDSSDLIDSDIVISFTEEPRSCNSRGGRHVEFGMALGLGKRCIVVGPRENVFHCIQDIEVFGSYDEMKNSI